MTLIEAVIQTYTSTASIKTTAKECSISQQKVRRILINAGLYKNDITEQIEKLLEQKMSLNEIAEHLKISIKLLNAYMPYKKGMYNDPNANKKALAMRKWRAKKAETGSTINSVER